MSDQLIRIGQAIKRRFPEYREHDDMEVGLAVLAEGKLEYAVETDGIRELINALADRASVDEGSFISWFRRRRSEARTHTNKQLEAEMSSLRSLLLQKQGVQDQIRTHQELEARRPLIEQGVKIKAQADIAQQQFYRDAYERGMDPTIYAKVSAKEVKAKIKVWETEKVNDLNHAHTLRTNEEEIKHKKRLNETEAEQIDRLRREEYERMMLVQSKDTAELNHLQKQLDALYEEMATIRQYKKPGWEDKINDRVHNVNALRGAMDVVRARLQQAPPGKDVGGTGKNTERSRDPRQSVEEDKNTP